MISYIILACLNPIIPILNEDGEADVVRILQIKESLVETVAVNQYGVIKIDYKSGDVIVVPTKICAVSKFSSK
jgi:hypothetical protein